MQALRFLDAFLSLKVGKPNPKVMLWPNPIRRDKPWNYIALEFQKYTKPLLCLGLPNLTVQRCCFANKMKLNHS
jgi:hypothetical protein